MGNPKFMMAVSDSIYRKLGREAKTRGINIQELIRSKVIPEWMEQNNGVRGTIDIDKLLHLLEKYPLNGKNGKAKPIVTRKPKQR